MEFTEFWNSLVGQRGIVIPEWWAGFLFLYIGPETILPLTSFLAAIVGFLLMFWRWVVGSCKRGWKWCSRTVKRLCGIKIEESAESLSDLTDEKSENMIDGKS